MPAVPASRAAPSRRWTNSRRSRSVMGSIAGRGPRRHFSRRDDRLPVRVASPHAARVARRGQRCEQRRHRRRARRAARRHEGNRIRRRAATGGGARRRASGHVRRVDASSHGPRDGQCGVHRRRAGDRAAARTRAHDRRERRERSWRWRRQRRQATIRSRRTSPICATGRSITMDTCASTMASASEFESLVQQGSDAVRGIAGAAERMAAVAPIAERFAPTETFESEHALRVGEARGGASPLGSGPHRRRRRRGRAIRGDRGRGGPGVRRPAAVHRRRSGRADGRMDAAYRRAARAVRTAGRGTVGRRRRAGSRRCGGQRGGRDPTHVL